MTQLFVLYKKNVLHDFRKINFEDIMILIAVFHSGREHVKKTYPLKVDPLRRLRMQVFFST